MNVSSNVLFHFTNSLGHLVNILTNEFSPRYCPEYTLGEENGSAGRGKAKGPQFAFPMVCFCDLPLSLIKSHLAHYGMYGIGMHKHWGIMRGITPVLYIHTKSLLLGALKSWANGEPAERESSIPFRINRRYDDVMNVMRYVRLYEGLEWRNGSCNEGVKFYDEREWRYSPVGISSIESVLDRKSYTNKDMMEEFTARLKHKYALHFSPDDVEYIIVKYEDEVLPMVRHLKNIKGGKYTEDQVSILTTSIISANRIFEDF